MCPIWEDRNQGIYQIITTPFSLWKTLLPFGTSEMEHAFKWSIVTVLSKLLSNNSGIKKAVMCRKDSAYWLRPTRLWEGSHVWKIFCWRKHFTLNSLFCSLNFSLRQNRHRIKHTYWKCVVRLVRTQIHTCKTTGIIRIRIISIVPQTLLCFFVFSPSHPPPSPLAIPGTLLTFCVLW